MGLLVLAGKDVTLTRVEHVRSSQGGRYQGYAVRCQLSYSHISQGVQEMHTCVAQHDIYIQFKQCCTQVIIAVLKKYSISIGYKQGISTNTVL